VLIRRDEENASCQAAEIYGGIFFDVMDLNGHRLVFAQPICRVRRNMLNWSG